MQKFENHIRDQFKNREIAPKKDAWDRMEHLLDKKDNKQDKKFYYLIAASVVILLSLGTYFFKMNFEANQQNTIDINSNQVLVLEEEINHQMDSSSEEESEQVEIISESKILKTESDDKKIASISNEKREQIEFRELEPKVNEDVFREKNIIEETKQMVEFKTENSRPKTDPNRLLLVAEYERNVEKSASQFKQMKEKFQEVKTVLNNINQ